MAVAGEYSPSGSRVVRMMMVFWGFTAGAEVGGFVSAGPRLSHAREGGILSIIFYLSGSQKRPFGL